MLPADNRLNCWASPHAQKGRVQLSTRSHISFGVSRMFGVQGGHQPLLAQRQCRCAKRQLTAVPLFRLCSFEYEWLPSSLAGKSNIPEPYPKAFQHPIQNFSSSMKNLKFCPVVAGREKHVSQCLVSLMLKRCFQDVSSFLNLFYLFLATVISEQGTC